MSEKKKYVIEKGDGTSPYRSKELYGPVELTEDEYRLYQNKFYYLGLERLKRYYITPLNDKIMEEIDKLEVPDKCCIRVSFDLSYFDIKDLDKQYQYRVLKTLDDVKYHLNGNIKFNDPYIGTILKSDNIKIEDLVNTNKVLFLVAKYEDFNPTAYYMNLFIFGVKINVYESPYEFDKRIRNLVKFKIESIINDLYKGGSINKQRTCLLFDGGEK